MKNSIDTVFLVRSFPPSINQIFNIQIQLTSQSLYTALESKCLRLSPLTCTPETLSISLTLAGQEITGVGLREGAQRAS